MPLLPALIHKIFIKWWDRFCSPISLDSLPFSKRTQTALFLESVALASRNYATPMKLGTSSTLCPPVMYPNLYLQYLQVKEKFPDKTAFEA